MASVEHFFNELPLTRVQMRTIVFIFQDPDYTSQSKAILDSALHSRVIKFFIRSSWDHLELEVPRKGSYHLNSALACLVTRRLPRRKILSGHKQVRERIYSS